MSTLVSQIITDRVRPALFDESINDAERRWTDDILIKALDDAQIQIVSDRSEESLDTDGFTQRTYAAPAALGDTVFVSDKWREALMHYICARAFEMPGDERQNFESAGYHQEQFNNALKTK
jgi:hypothetical protein